MKIENVRVYGLEESIIASGYPKKIEVPNEKEFEDTVNMLSYAIDLGMEDFDDVSKENSEKYLKRVKNLASAKLGSGHNCALKGVIAQYDLTAPEYFWRQFDRYHFHDYISSQSKMHRILKFDVDKMCNPYVKKDIKVILKDEIDLYNIMNKSTKTPKEEIQKQFQRIISNCPMGIELTARITDNYLQLKSKYAQRKHHKLEEWQYYCNWIETLPMSELIIDKEDI